MCVRVPARERERPRRWCRRRERERERGRTSRRRRSGYEIYVCQPAPAVDPEKSSRRRGSGSLWYNALAHRRKLRAPPPVYIIHVCACVCERHISGESWGQHNTQRWKYKDSFSTRHAGQVAAAAAATAAATLISARASAASQCRVPLAYIFCFAKCTVMLCKFSVLLQRDSHGLSTTETVYLHIYV